MVGIQLAEVSEYGFHRNFVFNCFSYKYLAKVKEIEFEALQLPYMLRVFSHVQSITFEK